MRGRPWEGEDFFREEVLSLPNPPSFKKLSKAPIPSRTGALESSFYGWARKQPANIIALLSCEIVFCANLFTNMFDHGIINYLKQGEI